MRGDRQGEIQVNHVGAISGGKDSTAMALWLNENEPRDYTWVCTPTGDELPEMFEHWRKLGNLLGKKLLPIMAHTGLSVTANGWQSIPHA
jgi:3'-phosphoadenosine 5'-phosphosulfate sulfotransferase (PAPS reductase)/FAD synthetase